MRFPLTWRFFVRRGWLLVAGVLIGVLVAGLIARSTVSSTAVYAVDTTGGYQPPYQQQRLALDYAQLIPQRRSVLEPIARAIGRSPEYVRARLHMVAEPETNILYARFSGPSEAISNEALRALPGALRHSSDAAGTSFAKTVRQINPPGRGGGMSRKRALLIGALGGFVLAFSLALGLERRHPRVDDLDDLAGFVSLPVSRISLRARPELEAATAASGAGLVPLGAVPALREARSTPEESPTPWALVIRRGAAVADVEEVLARGMVGNRGVAAALLVSRRSIFSRATGRA